MSTGYDQKRQNVSFDSAAEALPIFICVPWDAHEKQVKHPSYLQSQYLDDFFYPTLQMPLNPAINPCPVSKEKRVMTLQRWWQSDHLHMKNWRGKMEILSTRFNLYKIISESNPAALQKVFGCKRQRNAKRFIGGDLHKTW